MKIKNLVTFSLMIFITLVVIILGVAVFANQPKIPATNPAVNNNNTTAVTSADVAKHNTSGDCWLVVSGAVYNVTNFIPIHTGGANQIIPFCGKDATSAFATKNGRGSHRQGDLSILSNYLVGNLAGTNTLPVPSPSQIPPSSGEDD